MAFSRFKSAADEAAADLNVVPVMNLFMVLIPFLLLGATFFHIGVIPTSTPTLSPSDSDVPKTPTTVAVNMEIDVDTIAISAASVSLSEEQLTALSGEWGKKAGKYPVKDVQAALLDIKGQYPESNTITVLPHEKLGYQDLVEILDHTRNHVTGKDKDGEDVREDLFPVTIFSRKITENPINEGEDPEGEGEAGGEEEMEMDEGGEE